MKKKNDNQSTPRIIGNYMQFNKCIQSNGNLL